jgi:hypothetical protein
VLTGVAADDAIVTAVFVSRKFVACLDELAVSPLLAEAGVGAAVDFGEIA